MDRLVFVSDSQALRCCNKGVRLFFSQNGLSYSDFVHNGIDEQLLLDTNDAMARKVVEYARVRRGQDGRR